MTEQTKTTETTTAFGEKLDTPLPYDYKWTNYDSIDEVRAAKDELSDEEVVKYRNSQRELNARNKAMNAMLKTTINPKTGKFYEKPDLKNNDQFRLKEFVKVIMSSGRYTEAEAKTLAATTLGLAWADGDSE